MRTINISKEEIYVETIGENLILAETIDSDTQPCWYVDVDKSDKDDCSWKVGIKSKNYNEEYEFRFSEIGKTRTKETIESVNDPNFPIKLLDKFKSGGKRAVKDWFKNGCR